LAHNRVSDTSAAPLSRRRGASRQQRRPTTIDFTLSPELIELRDHTAAFVRDEVIPQEQLFDDHKGLPAERAAELRAKARAARLYDGPSEVHRIVIARNVLKAAAEAAAPSQSRSEQEEAL
jgi:hypothetical protein